MKSIVFAKNCTFKGKDFSIGNRLTKFGKDDLVHIWKLNENSFIEPLTEEEFKDIINKKFKNKNKEENDERNIA